MKECLLLLFLLFHLVDFAQHSLIFDLPCDKTTLKKNNVKTINVREKIDSVMLLTHRYELDEVGNAIEHFQHNSYTNGKILEKCRISNDTAGFVEYKRFYISDSEVKTLTHHYQHYYSKGNKALKFIHREYSGYTTVRISVFDTIHTDYEDKTEMRILSGGDTLFMTKDLFDGIERIHELKRKVDGKWSEHEIGISIYKNGIYESSSLYRNGKLIQEHRAADDLEKKNTDDYRDLEYGLPIPDPVIDTFYVNDFKNEKFETVKASKAKYKMLVHYDQGRGSGQYYYEIFDMKYGWVVSRFGPGKIHYTEFKYEISD